MFKILNLDKQYFFNAYASLGFVHLRIESELNDFTDHKIRLKIVKDFQPFSLK